MSTSRPTCLSSCLRFALLALLTSCGSPEPETVADEGGQTGSATCGSSPRCICDAVAHTDVVRGVVTFDGDTDANVEVLEVFGSDAQVSLGQVLSGPYQAGLPCGLGSIAPIADGAEVLVAYPEQVSGEPPPNMYVVSWAAVLQLTPDYTLPAQDAHILEDSVACGVRFPDEDPVCNSAF